MDICLIRHAEPAWVTDGTGNMDPDLTARGHDQAARLAARARGWPPVDEVWVSPAARSQQTASPLIEVLGAPARTLPWLLEAQGPDFEGLDEQAMRALFRGSRARPVAEWWAGLPGGEDMRHFVGRIEAGFTEELGGLGVTRHDDDPHWRGLPEGRRVVIVSHAGTSGAAMSHLVGVPQVPWAWERFRLRHAAMAVLRTRPVSDGLIFSLHTFNDCQHLPEDDRTT